VAVAHHSKTVDTYIALALVAVCIGTIIGWLLVMAIRS
jgi:hypothetical protein